MEWWLVASGPGKGHPATVHGAPVALLTLMDRSSYAKRYAFAKL